jgi:hypothetical protein
VDAPDGLLLGFDRHVFAVHQLESVLGREPRPTRIAAAGLLAAPAATQP